MTTKNFEDALTELIRHICEADPKGKAHAMQQLRNEAALIDGGNLRRVSLSDEDQLFDNMPV